MLVVVRSSNFEFYYWSFTEKELPQTANSVCGPSMVVLWYVIYGSLSVIFHAQFLEEFISIPTGVQPRLPRQWWWSLFPFLPPHRSYLCSKLACYPGISAAPGSSSSDLQALPEWYDVISISMSSGPRRSWSSIHFDKRMYEWENKLA